MFAIEVIAEELRAESRRLDYATFDGRDAARLTEVCAEIERLGAAAKVLFARRARRDERMAPRFSRGIQRAVARWRVGVLRDAGA